MWADEIKRNPLRRRAKLHCSFQQGPLSCAAGQAGEGLAYQIPPGEGSAHRGQAPGSCAAGLPGESVCRLGPCSGLPRCPQQTGHAAPAASSLASAGRGSFNPSPPLSNRVSPPPRHTSHHGNSTRERNCPSDSKDSQGSELLFRHHLENNFFNDPG